MRAQVPSWCDFECSSVWLKFDAECKHLLQTMFASQVAPRAPASLDEGVVSLLQCITRTRIATRYSGSALG